MIFAVSRVLAFHRIRFSGERTRVSQERAKSKKGSGLSSRQSTNNQHPRLRVVHSERSMASEEDGAEKKRATDRHSSDDRIDYRLRKAHLDQSSTNNRTVHSLHDFLNLDLERARSERSHRRSSLSRNKGELRRVFGR